MKRIFILLVLLLFVLFEYSGFAETLESNGTGGGDWDVANSWDGVNTPDDLADGDTLVIQLGDTITLSGNFTFNGVIQVYGVLVLDNGKLSMNATSVIQFAPGSDISANGTGQNNTISIGPASNSISTNDINDIVTPNQLTQDSLESLGCAVTGDCDDNPLPVDVVYFKAIELTGFIKLDWATTLEEDFDFFTIERSADGIYFDDYGKIHAQTMHVSQIRKYEFMDEMPFPGLSYYRLKSTDFDGSTTYHGVVAVNLEEVKPDILLYPNPISRGHFIVSFNGDQEATFKVLNIAGQVMMRSTLTPGINEINIAGSLVSSIYFIQVEGAQSNIIKKFLIR
jgi:hypothetical protein